LRERVAALAATQAITLDLLDDLAAEPAPESADDTRA
jgi:hypothetical protein